MWKVIKENMQRATIMEEGRVRERGKKREEEKEGGREKGREEGEREGGRKGGRKERGREGGRGSDSSGILNPGNGMHSEQRQSIQ